MQETWVRSLGQEDLLEKEMVTSSSILAWKISWTEETDGLYIVHAVTESDNDWATKAPPLLIQNGLYFYTKGKSGYRYAHGEDALLKLEHLDQGPPEARREPGADPSLNLWAPRSYISSPESRDNLGVV